MNDLRLTACFLMCLFAATAAPSQEASRTGSGSSSPPGAAGDQKAILSPDSLEFVGGWKMSSRGAGGKGLGYSLGGVYVEHGEGANRFLYLAGHGQAKDEYHKMRVSLERLGTNPADSGSWPEAAPVKLFSNTNVDRALAITRPNPGGALLTSGYHHYASKGDVWVGPWMTWVDPESDRRVHLGVPGSVNRRQPFGGGFCTIPRWFADAHLDGRDFGVGFGGYHSGQKSSLGPTLFVTPRPADYAQRLEDPVVLLEYQWQGPRETREARPPDYTRSIFHWPMPQGGVGTWQADQITAGPVWIDTPSLTGLCYWSVQGLGDLDYGLQNMAFSNERRTRLYVYSPEQLASVARGETLPYQVRGTWYEWPGPFDKKNAHHWPIGAYWDDDDQLLYMSFQRASKQRYETAPAVCVFRLKSSG